MLLPLPSFYGFGSTDYNHNKYRFIVIEKFDKDLDVFLQTVPNKALLGAVINIIRQIVNKQYIYFIMELFFNLYFFYRLMHWNSYMSVDMFIGILKVKIYLWV